MIRQLTLYFFDALSQMGPDTQLKLRIDLPEDDSLCEELGELGVQTHQWLTTSLANLTEDFLEPLSGLDCQVVLGAQNCLYNQVVLPGKQNKHLRQALPFMVEDRLASDIDDMHYAIGQRSGANQYPVVMIERDILEDFLETLANLGLTPSSLRLDTDALDVNQLHIGRDRCLLKTQTEQLAFDTLNLEQALDSLFNDDADEDDATEQPQALTVFAEQELDSAQQLVLKSLDSSGIPIDLSAARLTDMLDENLGGKHSIEILQGDYTPAKKRSQSQIHWQPFAKVAGIILVVNFLYYLGAGFYFNMAAEQQKADTKALYKQLFPKDRRIVNIKQQTATHLRNASAGGGSGFLALLGQFSTHFDPSIEISQMRFDNKRGQMIVELKAKSIGQLDGLRQKLSQNGIRAELQSADESADGARGRLQLGG